MSGGIARDHGLRGQVPLGSDPLGSDPLGSDPLGSDPLGSDPFVPGRAVARSGTGICAGTDGADDGTYRAGRAVGEVVGSAV